MAKEINLLEESIEQVPPEPPLPHEPEQPDLFPDLIDRSGKTKKSAPKHDEKMRIQVKRLIEALLFAASEPLSLEKIREISDTMYPLKPRHLRELIDELKNDYIVYQRAYRLEEIAQGFSVRSCEEFSSYISLLYRDKRTEKLSQAATEVLAIIAYKQPITRPQIEAIRGVDCSGIMQTLLERQLIAPVGKLEAPGRPTLYGITKDFLKHYGLKDIQDLPKVEAKL